ncbi:tumor necrosis factor receptor superfamily member 14-like [Colossoma macropomum]|uniref:tumor necrosis factor receptor superfamily member 14-like n=1 Tax=Colossoma macropomum TaxID=42526 RepID=UPI0018647C62|nr:tumor necrosis factor receptor superfamily member 14-like [Colossoma macropomum]
MKRNNVHLKHQEVMARWSPSLLKCHIPPSCLKKRMKCLFLRFSLYIFGVHIILTYGCDPTSYVSVAGDCCPLCPIGAVVLRDCIGDSNTTCEPCDSGMFMNQPNDFNKCFPCKTCDSAKGLYVSHTCTIKSDTACEVMDGYYCKQYSGIECTFALKHRQCGPGEQIMAPGTKDSDTVCEPCPPGFYSPLGINCVKLTNCSVKDEIKDKEDSSVDVQCTPASRGRYGLIATVVLLLPEVLWLAFSYVKQNCLVTSKETKCNGNNTDASGKS